MKNHCPPSRCNKTMNICMFNFNANIMISFHINKLWNWLIIWFVIILLFNNSIIFLHKSIFTLLLFHDFMYLYICIKVYSYIYTFIYLLFYTFILLLFYTITLLYFHVSIFLYLYILILICFHINMFTYKYIRERERHFNSFA